MRLAGGGAIVAFAFFGIVLASDSLFAQETGAGKTIVCANPSKDLVLLTVTVANRRGRFVENLSSSDFTVTSNDRPQKRQENGAVFCSTNLALLRVNVEANE